MSRSSADSRADERIREEASQWVLRVDRGLSAEEQDAYSQWLAADDRHRGAVAKFSSVWDDFDRLAGLHTSMNGAPNPDLLAAPRAPAPDRTGASRRWLIGLAAAASIAGAVALARWSLRPESAAISPQMLATIAPPCEQRVLDDGSSVQLNRGAAIQVIYRPDERRIRLDHGEAHFTVAKHPQRPFVVSSPGLEVQAIGTAFDVRLVSGGAEVLVTQGHVKVAATGSSERVDAVEGQAVTVRLGGAQPAMTLSIVGDAEAASRLAWRPRMLDFTAVPLSEVVAEFNRHNRVQLAVGDESLKGLKLSATFRSDNVSGFVRLMEADFEMKAERGADGRIILRSR